MLFEKIALCSYQKILVGWFRSLLTLGLATLQQKALRKLSILLLSDFTDTVPSEQCDPMGYLALIHNTCWKTCLPRNILGLWMENSMVTWQCFSLAVYCQITALREFVGDSLTFKILFLGNYLYSFASTCFSVLPEEFLLLSHMKWCWFPSAWPKKKERLSRLAPAGWVKEWFMTKWLSFQRAFYSEIN